MAEDRESVFVSILRAFFVTFFRFIGFALALLVMIIVATALVTGVSGKNDVQLDLKYNVKVLPDAQGKMKKLSDKTPLILSIPIEGVIGVGKLSMEKVRRQLIESRIGDFKNNRVKAILLSINTPGGTVIDSEGIFQALKEYKELYKVPVYAYVEGLCASGGVYVTAAADKIIASEVSLIGSVGVLMPTFFNVTDLLEKIGVQSVTLLAGKGKDEMNPFRPWKKGEEGHFQAIADYYYKNFVDLVVAHRPIDKERLVNDYGAQIFPAPIAKDNGYIDSINSSMRSVLEELSKAAGLEGKEYQVVQLEESKWLSELFSSSSVIFTGKIKHEVHLLPELDSETMGQFMYMYRPF